MSTETTPQQAIFNEFSSAAECGWVRGEILYRMSGRMAEAEFEAVDAEGGVSYPDVSGTALFKAIEELRRAMAGPGTGAWMSATIALASAGGFSLDADFDNEPAWDVPVVAETYAEEQDLFPRDEQNQPDWYRQKVREANKG